MNKFKIGLYGENRVHEILNGSEWLNKEIQTFEAYDILWNGIKIDIKTSTNFINNRFIFTVKRGIRHKGIILVFVGLHDGKEYFWVDQYHSETKSIHYIKDAIEVEDLPREITKESLRIVMDIDNNKSDYRTIPISAALDQKIIDLCEAKLKQVDGYHLDFIGETKHTYPDVIRKESKADQILERRDGENWRDITTPQQEPSHD